MLFTSAHRPALFTKLFLLGSLLCACGRVAAATPPTTQFLPVVPGIPESRSTPFISWSGDLSLSAYVEEEYSISGTANTYTYTDDAAQTPATEIVDHNIPYTTRILLRRPEHPGNFSGTVFLELLNATAGWDGDPIWQSNHEYIIRSGAAWLGITARPVTVDFLRHGWGSSTNVARNASRYRSLSMPEEGQVWDMLSQVGLLLKTPTSNHNPLSRFAVARVIMVGYSQSADYQVTYANSFHSEAQTTSGEPVYDGYFISAGHGQAKHVRGPGNETPEYLPENDRRNLIRADAPVIRFQSQTEVIGFAAYLARQTEADYPNLRFYEMAGGAHVEAHLNATGGPALVRDLGLPPSFCPEPANAYNPIRISYVQSALLDALVQWISNGSEPPASRFMELSTRDGSPALLRDPNGNGVGGIRPPALQVPLGRYLENNSGPGFCSLFGGFIPFDDEKLRALYPNQEAFIIPITLAIRRSESQGFLLAHDAETMLKEASASTIGTWE